MTLDVAVFLVGVGLLALGSIGGDFKLYGFEIPRLTKLTRGVFIFFGFPLAGLGVWLLLATLAGWGSPVGAGDNDDASERAVSQEYTLGIYTGYDYEGEAKVFSCSRGLNLNTSKKVGISAFCVLQDGSVLERGLYTGRMFQGDHRVFSCPEGTVNAESGGRHGIFAWCYDGKKTFVRGRNTGGTHEGKYKVFSCPAGSVNLETGSGVGISGICKK